MDIQKEREAFDQYFKEKYQEFHNEVFDENGDDRAIIGYSFAWSAWRAAKAQAVPEGFVLVPMVPSERMINAVRQCYEGEAYLPYSLYSEFVNQAIIERMEAQEPAND